MNRGRLADLLIPQIPRLRRYARALTRTPEAADDLVQDSLERAWRKLDQWETGSDLRAWLFTLMHNVHINELRRHRPDMEPMARREYPATEQNGPDKAMRLRDLEAGLAHLSSEQREVLFMVCLEGMTYEQVATVLGIPIGTVMSRLHRGRERLRRWMAGGDDVIPTLRRVK